MYHKGIKYKLINKILFYANSHPSINRNRPIICGLVISLDFNLFLTDKRWKRNLQDTTNIAMIAVIHGDYMDDRCPECGSPETTEMSAKEVKVHYCFHPEPEFSRILEMLDRHGD